MVAKPYIVQWFAALGDNAHPLSMFVVQIKSRYLQPGSQSNRNLSAAFSYISMAVTFSRARLSSHFDVTLTPSVECCHAANQGPTAPTGTVRAYGGSRSKNRENEKANDTKREKVGKKLFNYTVKWRQLMLCYCLYSLLLQTFDVIDVVLNAMQLGIVFFYPVLTLHIHGRVYDLKWKWRENTPVCDDCYDCCYDSASII